MIQYNENNKPNKYGVTRREKYIFELAKANKKPGKNFTAEELEYYEECMDDFKWADEVGKSRDSFVQWFND